MRLIDADKIEWEFKCISKEEIDEMPTVKAIPIEWIKKWISSEPLGTESLIAPEFTIEAMLYWWEKENE